MRWFAAAEFLISATDSNSHQGGLMCRIPPGLTLRTVAPTATAAGVFRKSVILTSDGAVAIVPTPGHTPGHQSVLVQANGHAWLFGGDAAFSWAQVQQDHLAGIAGNPRAARALPAKLWQPCAPRVNICRQSPCLRMMQPLSTG